MKKSLLMTASVLVLFSLVIAGTGAVQKSAGKGLTNLEHGVEF